MAHKHAFAKIGVANSGRDLFNCTCGAIKFGSNGDDDGHIVLPVQIDSATVILEPKGTEIEPRYIIFYDDRPLDSNLCKSLTEVADVIREEIEDNNTNSIDYSVYRTTKKYLVESDTRITIQ